MSVDDTNAEQLATAHCTSVQQSGGVSAPAMAKADRLVRNATEQRKPLKRVLHSCRVIYHSAQVQPSSLHNCSSIKLAPL